MLQAPPPSLPLAREVQPLLHTRTFGRMLRGYETVDSTNTLAAGWAEEGAPEGSVVLAEYQEAGRGRLGRRWKAAAGQNLMFSVVLRPVLSSEHLGLIPLAAGLAVAEAIAGFTHPVEPSIKWPNDVLLDGLKCCGMLLESAWPHPRAASPPAIILGIGLNVNQIQFPPDLADRATSLLLATGRHVPRPALLAHLLERLEQRYRQVHDTPDAIRSAYEARMHRRGRTVCLACTPSETSAEPSRIEGRVLGVSDTGALRLQTDSGIRTFHAGEVTTL